MRKGNVEVKTTVPLSDLDNLRESLSEGMQKRVSDRVLAEVWVENILDRYLNFSYTDTEHIEAAVGDYLETHRLRLEEFLRQKGFRRVGNGETS